MVSTAVLNSDGILDGTDVFANDGFLVCFSDTLVKGGKEGDSERSYSLTDVIFFGLIKVGNSDGILT